MEIPGQLRAKSKICMCVCVCMSANLFHLCPTLCNPMIASQAPLSMEFSRQEYWSGLPCPPLGDLPNPGIEFLCLLHWQPGSLLSAPAGKPKAYIFEAYKVSM